MTVALYHFSEDPSIDRFVPHVPDTNQSHPPAVWAISETHAPLYWFPRDCPRVTAWPRDDSEVVTFRDAFRTVADRIHVMELSWVDTMRSTQLYRYRFDAASFRPWAEASGQWISETEVIPIETQRVGDLFDRHVEAGIELRIVPSLWPLHDLARSDRWDFSMVRMVNALPR